MGRVWLCVWLVLGAAGCSGDDSSMTSDAATAASDATGFDADESLRFTNLRIEELGAYRAVLRFTTSRPTTCEAEFGVSETTLDRTATDPNMEPGTYLEQHEVPLEDLVPNTAYYAVARAEDEVGAVFRSQVVSFTTSAGAAVDSMTNVAVLSAGSTVTAVSSNYGLGANDSAWGANNAIDGQMASEWASNGDGDGAFVQIDLGQMRTFTVVGFRSRKMTDGTSIIEKFRLVVDGTTTLGPFVSPDPDVRYVFDLGTSVTGRVVRLEAIDSTGGNTGIKELQLLAP